MSELEAKMESANREALVQLLGRLVPEDSVVDPVEGIRLTRASEPSDRVFGATRPSFCVIAQGAKELYLGDQRYLYNPDQYLLATVELPVTGRVIQASPEKPYLAVRVELDPMLVGSVMIECGLPPVQGPAKAVVVSPFGAELLDATVRLIRLMSSPQEAKALMPLVLKEIVYRLLVGEQGTRLRHLPKLGGHSDRVAQAIDKLRSEFNRPLRIESLARELGMSSSGFHHHFKAVTDMSPLQFQKELRLQEARRLMLGANLDAASASFRVGYEDASHFSRDYKRHFGESPVRDVERLRSMVVVD